MMNEVTDEFLQPLTIDWQGVQTVFLDMDGTLLDLHFDDYFWLEHLPLRLAQKRNTSLDSTTTTLHEMYTTLAGTLNWYCLDYWEHQLDTDLVAIKQEIAHKIAIREHVFEFLDFLQHSGKQIVLLTNAHQKSVGLKLGYIALEHYFERIITSHSIGFAKEHPEFWVHLEQHYEFDKARTVFIDDNLHVLRSAQAYGVKHLFAIYQPNSQHPPKDTEEFTAIRSYRQLMTG